MGNSCIRYLSHGPNLVVGLSQPEWTWENIVNEGNELQYVVDVLHQGMAIWVTDGSLYRVTVPLVSGLSGYYTALQ